MTNTPDHHTDAGEQSYAAAEIDEADAAVDEPPLDGVSEEQSYAAAELDEAGADTTS